MKPARPSSAVILFRETGGRAEIFMGQRHGKASTFASTFVFPGGVVDTHDELVDDYCRGLDSATADAWLALEGGGLAFFSTAIRELFEETGVLLATDDAGNWISADSALASLRAPLAAGSLAWADVLARTGARLALDHLHYVGHWETPLAISRRFSTRFFVAELPPDQIPVHDGDELVDSRWLEPRSALRLNRSGDIELPFPQLKHMEMLAELDTADDLRDWARCRRLQPVPRVRPWLVKENDERRFVLPWETDYPEDA